jgi:hypothetical protein
VTRKNAAAPRAIHAVALKVSRAARDIVFGQKRFQAEW